MSEEVINFCEVFNAKLLEIVNSMHIDEDTVASAELERLQNRIRMGIRGDPTLVLCKHSDHIWKHKKKILSIYDRETDTYTWDIFLNYEIGANDAAKAADAAGSSITQLFECIKGQFRNSSEAEKIELYQLCVELLGCIKEYRTYCKTTKQ